MKELAITAENISKQYRLGQVGTGTLSHDLNRLWSKVRGKENPYLKIGDANDRTSSGGSEYVWSLRDINFEIEKGDAVGIIGRNGAGKSTLLKLLSKVTKPTTGSFKVNGRIASLLEVGTGFNPEMTGRENIYLNGAILGMRRQEITRKFDEIVAFSGVERYIDTPVKRYSSGMYVRLAFAVAAHLESEILIVDEVLAVGDAEFQKKCLGKMDDVSKGEGRTVLFVSHNMAAVKSLCTKGILLENGILSAYGKVTDVQDKYSNNTTHKSEFNYIKRANNYISKIVLMNGVGVATTVFNHADLISIQIALTLVFPKVTLAINLKDSNFNVIFIDELELSDSGVFTASLPSEFLIKGTYYIDVYLYIPNVEFLDKKVDEIVISIIDLPTNYMNYENSECGIIKSPLIWNK